MNSTIPRTKSVTLTTPKGHKVRTSRKTRYAVVVDRNDGAWITKGSSSLETARGHLRWARNKGYTVPRYIFDLTTKEIVK